MSDNVLISTVGLSVGYRIGKGLFNHSILKAVDNVSIEIEKGSFFGLVGESGSGKTTLGRALLNCALSLAALPDMMTARSATI